ncbi:IS200/IS605 family transposase [Candidatus Falkowbacteria bacterium]|jgi:putative transposase|nr:IS200/IS605 family transposase [Candidatus Falkowbacteria bacterium]MBT5502858.1 IS200/IS605 family transposase [Candidatus Falkowbacteria bacterium]MBT6574611.1 IS200/IS605 family transposase [Candidatus Falkowbacteria bacterium]MBT7348885.1 IS200/IS605 family transposase [Candidatus Falkowbacteria bacterium]MBT7501036.1 IS200/IS605 family transposase [Candidatus Falkowbacteria bacterium]
MPTSYYKLFYHFIWATKNRSPIITTQIENQLKQFIPHKTLKLNAKQLKLEMVEDHLHLLARIPPKISVSAFVNSIKGSSSHYINAILDEKIFYWQTGFGVLSLAEKQLPFVAEYIKNQKQKHKDNDLISVFEEIPRLT